MLMTSKFWHYISHHAWLRRLFSVQEKHDITDVRQASDDNYFWKMALPISSDKIWTHWGRVMHTCVSFLTIIGPDNGLSPDRRQAIICPNAMILLIGP